MIVLYLILLAVIQAVTEFLPVSSLGHLGVMEHFLGMEQDTCCIWVQLQPLFFSIGMN